MATRQTVKTASTDTVTTYRIYSLAKLAASFGAEFLNMGPHLPACTCMTCHGQTPAPAFPVDLHVTPTLDTPSHCFCLTTKHVVGIRAPGGTSLHLSILRQLPTHFRNRAWPDRNHRRQRRVLPLPDRPSRRPQSRSPSRLSSGPSTQPRPSRRQPSPPSTARRSHTSSTPHRSSPSHSRRRQSPWTSTKTLT